MDDPGRIVAELRGTPLHPLDAAAATAGIPNEPGFYAWWAVAGAIPGVPAQRHPSEPFELLYVGIAPSRERSTARLRSRVLRQHVGGNIAASTFRFGLAALLWKRERWTPSHTPSGRFRLATDDERALRAWIEIHLRVRWCVVRAPWLIEADVVRELQPPMNREHNASHAFYATMGEARTRLRERALER